MYLCTEFIINFNFFTMNAQTITGGFFNVGTSTNKLGRPTVYLQKHYPTKGDKNYFNWVIVTPKGLAKDFKNRVLKFERGDFERAKANLKIIRKTF